MRLSYAIPLHGKNTRKAFRNRNYLHIPAFQGKGNTTTKAITESERTDQELIHAANAGDTHAFEALYHRYRDWVVNLAFRFTGDRELAMDVLQETFFYFARKFPGFTLTCQLRSFLYPVVNKHAITASRKAQR